MVQTSTHIVTCQVQRNAFQHCRHQTWMVHVGQTRLTAGTLIATVMAMAFMRDKTYLRPSGPLERLPSMVSSLIL
jgi:hypothetical protein